MGVRDRRDDEFVGAGGLLQLPQPGDCVQDFEYQLDLLLAGLRRG
ncbi:hypothetical protein AB0M83_18030 [Amycolatopsis sp. NPDC051106]